MKRRALREWRDSLDQRRAVLEGVSKAVASGELPDSEIQLHLNRLMTFQEEWSLYEAEAARFTAFYGPIDPV